MNDDASHVMFPGVTLPTNSRFPQAVGYETALNCSFQRQLSSRVTCLELRLTMRCSQHSKIFIGLPTPVPYTITLSLMRLHTGLSRNSLKSSASNLSMPGFYTDRSIALHVWSYFFFNTKWLQKLNKTTYCQNSKEAPRSSCCQTVWGWLNKQLEDNPNPEPVLPKMMPFVSFAPSDMIPG